MNDNVSVRRTSRIRRAPARLVPGNGEGLKPTGSHSSQSDNDGNDVEQSAETREGGEATQSTESQSSHSSDDEDGDPPSSPRSRQRRAVMKSSRPKSSRRLTQGRAVSTAKRQRRASASCSGEHLPARQADAGSQGPSFQELPKAAISAVTAALLPPNFPASNLVSYVISLVNQQRS